jgi:uncharacterized protein involved in exopolysaccharide biosynthesis
MTAADQDQPDGSTPPPGDGAPGAERSGYGQTPREDEVSLLDILLVLVRNKTLIVRTVLIFTLLGVTYAILAPKEFTSKVQVVPEAQQDGSGLPGGIPSGALSGLGIGLGGVTGGGLKPAAFPDVLRSREVRLAVVQDTFRFPDAERPMTFVDYVNRPPGPLGIVLKYTVKLPWTLKGWLGEMISGPPAPAGTTSAGEPLILSEEEEEALQIISDRVSSSIDEETGIMTIAVKAGGSFLVADLAESFLDRFTSRVREVRTEKVREKLDFVKKRFEESERELETAEDRLARFLERNQNPTTATLKFRRDRLQRQVGFKEKLYRDLQSQLTQTRIDLQRQKPVVTVVKEPVPPLKRSAPKRTLLVILSVFLGGGFAVLVVFLRKFFSNSGEEEKVEEIAERLSLGKFFPLRSTSLTGEEAEKEV